MLEFLIQTWYVPLARRYIFIHAHETSWHYKRNVFEQIHRLTLSPYFREHDYGAVFPSYDLYHGRDMSEEMYFYVYHNTSMPPHTIDEDNLRPCCSTFFVDSDLVRLRTAQEYRLIISRLRQWSRENPTFNGWLPSVFCSRIMEYTWHILLSNRTSIPRLPKDLE
jgi:hypothetical protein